MSIKVNISDGTGKGTQAIVTERGQVVTSSIDFSVFYPVTLNLVSTGFEVVPPVSGKNFIITTIFLYADKNVGAADALVELYESDESAITTVDKSVFTTEIPKYGRIALTGLQIEISKSKWLNASTNDANIFLNVAGYYVKSL